MKSISSETYQQALDFLDVHTSDVPREMGNSFIIADEEQAKEQTHPYIEQTVAYLFDDERAELTRQVLERGPLIALITFPYRTSPSEIGAYVNFIAQQEHPELYAGVKPRSINDDPTTPRVVLSSPTGGFEKLCDILSREKKLVEDPYTHIFDTPFMSRLQDDIFANEFGDFREYAGIEYSAVNEITDRPYCCAFAINEEHVYIAGSEHKTSIIGIHSTPQKEQRYAVRNHYSMNRTEKDDAKIGGIVQDLLTLGLLKIKREYGEQQLKALENRAIIREGLRHIGSDPEKAKKLIQLKISSMEKYALIPSLAKSQNLEGLDLATWQAIRHIINGRSDIHTVKPHHYLHFVEAKDTVTDALLSHLSFGMRSTEIKHQYQGADDTEKGTIIAAYLLNRPGPLDTAVASCVRELGEASSPKVVQMASLIRGILP